MLETPAAAPPKPYTELTYSPGQVNAVGVPLSLGLLLLCAAPYVLLWGPGSLVAGLGALGLWVLPVFVAGVVVHELLHGLGWKLAAGLPWTAIKFGVQWKVLMPYAHARLPMGVRAYRLGAALPGLVTGVLPVVAALALGQPVLLILGAFFLTAAVGDLMILWLIRKLPPTARVLDHPTLPGCLVLKES